MICGGKAVLACLLLQDHISVWWALVPPGVGYHHIGSPEHLVNEIRLLHCHGLDCLSQEVELLACGVTPLCAEHLIVSS